MSKSGLLDPLRFAVEFTLRLDPAEYLLNALADALADCVAGVARRARVDGGLAPLAGLADRVVDSDVRRDLAIPQIPDEIRHVIGFVGPSVMRRRRRRRSSIVRVASRSAVPVA